MTVLKIAHAIFGERDRGHRLLAASPSFTGAKALEGRMDMQGSPPPYTTWDPYFSGFAWEQVYVLARTVSDPKAARSGMVFSRAIAIPAAEASAMDDIGVLLNLLTAMGDERDDIIEDVDWVPTVSKPQGSQALVRAILSDGASPAVWLGQAGFSDAISSLWANLWPAARLRLSFRIAFSPQDVSTAPPTVVTTPLSLASRWSGHTVVRDSEGIGEPTSAEALLLGLKQASSLQALVDEMGTAVPEIAGLKRLVEIDRLVGEGAGFAELLDGLRLVCHLSPDPSQAKATKEALTTRATAAVSTASVADVRMVRNLDLKAIASPEEFWKAIEQWSVDNLWLEPNPNLIAQLLDDLLSPKPVTYWREATITGVKHTLSYQADNVAPALWRVVQLHPTALAHLYEQFGKQSRLESALVGAVPKTLSLENGKALAATSVKLGLVRLHAACCGAFLAPVDAVLQHVADVSFDSKSIQIAACKASESDWVEIAVIGTDEATLTIAAEKCAAKPGLLKHLDILNPRWRSLWLRSLQRNVDAWTGPSKPKAAMAKLLDGVAGRVIKDIGLIQALSGTPLANLLDYPRRTEVWSHLPATSRHTYLAATADAWLASFIDGTDQDLEDELAALLAEPGRLNPTLEQLVGSPSRGCALFRTLPQLTERIFSEWLEKVLNQASRLDKSDSEAVGRLIAAKNWSDSAYRLAEFTINAKREDLRPAILYVVDLVGITMRFRLDMLGQSPSDSARWRILEEVATELYAWGPGQDGLWIRAGGKESHIPKADTGGEAWRIIVSKAERGKGDIDIHRLVEVMAEDYPENFVLCKMRYDSLFKVRS